MGYNNKFCKYGKSKSPFQKEGGDPPEKNNITTSYTYEPGNNSAASRFKEIVGGVSSGDGKIKEEDSTSKGKKKESTRRVPVKF